MKKILKSPFLKPKLTKVRCNWLIPFWKAAKFDLCHFFVPKIGHQRNVNSKELESRKFVKLDDPNEFANPTVTHPIIGPPVVGGPIYRPERGNSRRHGKSENEGK
jgi:hypothetical protein